LKLDVQGAELLILKNAPKILKNCLIIHTEVEFLEMYKKQPLFSDIEHFLRKKGFILHNFHTLDRRMVSPLANPNNEFDGLNQVLFADAVFIKDFTKLYDFSRLQLLKYCIILHDIYKSFDIVLRTLFFIDNKFETNYANIYSVVLNSNKSTG
ncbi:MAG: FkbM family methyltransferase, partial [Bacteroidetes bacterium]|nr:FkbM family methyltransferase [Bacteroidota bacterium]